MIKRLKSTTTHIFYVPIAINSKGCIKKKQVCIYMQTVNWQLTWKAISPENVLGNAFQLFLHITSFHRNSRNSKDLQNKIQLSRIQNCSEPLCATVFYDFDRNKYKRFW